MVDPRIIDLSSLDDETRHKIFMYVRGEKESLPQRTRDKLLLCKQH